MKIALMQMNPEWEEKDKNLSKAVKFIKEAAELKCDAIVFPEMFNTGFSMNISAIAEDENGETYSVLSEIAKKCGIYLIAGFPVKEQGTEKGRNIAVVYDRKGMLIAAYTKIHPFSFSNEDKYYIAGSDTVIFNIDRIPSSIFICYDLRFPEVFRKVAKDVQAIFVIANWPSSRKDHWETLLKARAIENQCFIIGVNRAGKDGNGIEYHGGSMVFDPSGNMLCRCGEGEQLFVCEIDPEEINAVRAHYPFLRDMKD